MSKIYRPNCFIVTLVALVFGSGVFAQDNREVKKPEADQSVPTAVVSGRLVYEDTGLPALRHRVQLIPGQLLLTPQSPVGIPTAMTNENGEFTFRRVKAGEYYAFSQAVIDPSRSSSLFPLIVRPGAGGGADPDKVEKFKKEHTRVAVDGLHNLTINLTVVNAHFGSISGRVLDAAGAPAGRASVRVMSKGEKVFGASVLADEQGQYKITGLPAGEYIVSASPPVSAPVDAERKTSGYEGILGATFFPSTWESLNSPPVAVLTDRDTPNIEITLLARSLHSLAGTIVYGGDNQAVSKATIRLMPKTISRPPMAKPDIEDAMSNYFATSDANGHWSMANVPDGNYRLRVQTGAGNAKQPFVDDERDLKVEGGDIENLIVEVSKGSRISGVVSIEGDADLQFIDIHAARTKTLAVSHARLKGAGNFTLTAVPSGEVTLSAFALPREKFYVKSIEVNGIDLLRTNLNIGEGEEIKEAHIVVSTNVGVVSGRVLSATDSKPIKGASVVLRRVSDDRMRLPGGQLATITDERGNYLLSAAPGIYQVFASLPANGLGQGASERVSGPQVTLVAKENKQLDLRLP